MCIRCSLVADLPIPFFIFPNNKTVIPGNEDPVWGGKVPYSIKDNNSVSWIEGVFGVDAKVVGPVHLGWTVRYRRRINSTDCQIGDMWYVPGFGRYDKTNIGGTFNLSIGI